MKASKKLILVSAATIMLTVPVLANNHLSNPVAAASQGVAQGTTSKSNTQCMNQYMSNRMY